VAGTQLLLEVHLFHFSGDLYHHSVRVTILHKLRNEQCFGSFVALKQQIQKDVVTAKEFFTMREQKNGTN